METFSDHLRAKFQLLQSSDLVVGKIANKQAIADFTAVLNTTSPVSDYDKAVGDFIRFMYRHDRNAFNNRISGLKHLILLAGGGPIAGALGISGIVSIKYQASTSDFLVEANMHADTDRAISAINNSDNRNAQRRNNNQRPSVQIGHDKYPVIDRRGQNNRVRLPPLPADKYVGMLADAKKATVTAIAVRPGSTKNLPQQLMDLDWAADDDV